MRRKQLSRSCAPRILAKGDADLDRFEAWCAARDLAAAREKDAEISAELAGEPAWSERWWWLLRHLNEARKRLVKLEGR